MADRQRLPELRDRIACFELQDDQQTVILDATPRAFMLVSGTITEDGTMRGEGTHAGPLRLQRRLARLLAEDEQLIALPRYVRTSPYRSLSAAQQPTRSTR